MRMAHAFRSLKNEYLAVYKLLQNDLYLDMKEGQFIGELIKASNGTMQPDRARQIYIDLMKDAGLDRL
jgi:hypothetical protein